MSGFRLIGPPKIEPLSLDEAKQHLRVDHDAENDLIGAYVQAARVYAEHFTQRAFITQTWKFTLDAFPNAFGYGTVMGSPGFGQGYAGWIPGYARGSNVNIWFANGIVRLPFPRLQKINYIKYVDRANIIQTIDPATYQLDTESEPGRIAPVPTAIWPFTQLSLLAPAMNAITVEFVCGYGDTEDDVPATVRQAMRLIVGHFYANRETVITGLRAAAIEVPLAADSLLWTEKVLTAD